MYFCYFVIAWSPFEQNWIPFTPKCYVPTLVESGRMVRKIFFLFSAVYFSFCVIISAWKKGIWTNFKVEDFKYFCYFVVISPWKRSEIPALLWRSPRTYVNVNQNFKYNQSKIKSVKYFHVNKNFMWKISLEFHAKMFTWIALKITANSHEHFYAKFSLISDEIHMRRFCLLLPYYARLWISNFSRK